MKEIISLIKERIILSLKRSLCTHPHLMQVNRFPQTGTTGRGKIWKIYYCTDCQQYLCGRVGGKLFKVTGPDDFGFQYIC